MATVHEQLTEQFHRWEQRGRGWQVSAESVEPEPPFRPFEGHYLPDASVVDDGHRPTFLSSLVQGLSRKLSTQPPSPPSAEEEVEEPEPQPLVRDSLLELQTSLPAQLDIKKEAFEQFLSNLSLCREPLAFELVGQANRVTAQFAFCPADAPLVRRQLEAHFPEARFQLREHTLEDLWYTCSGKDELVVEFGLAKEFMLPLASGKLDPFIGIIGALSELQPEEVALFQVLWQPVRNAWAESIVRSVTHADGKPFFVNMPELARAAETKASRPIYAAVVRLATKAGSFEKALQVACDLAGSLRVFAHPQGNELIPLRNDIAGYSLSEHVADMLQRQTRRSGMLLTSDELIGFVHLPGSAVRSPALQRDTGKTKAAPAIGRQSRGLVFGTNEHAGETTTVCLAPEQRVRHCHIIGASGTGKSTLMFNLIRQDIQNGEGLAVFDPHGDLVDRVLGIIPPERMNDVVLVDPADEEYSIGFNLLSAHSEHEKTLLASDLVSVFQRLSTSWGDQMQSVLQNAILAFLNSSRGGTLADLRRFLVEPAFRNEFLKSVSDPNVLYYWQKGFTHLSGNKSIGPVLTRLEMFLAQRPIAHMVSQPKNRLDIGEIMDGGKIFLAKLPEGLLGRENAHLLGALLVAKFQQLVMARQARKVAARRDFWIYIDEFANFITPSMAEILSGARKYRIGLTLAHHELHQLQRSPEVASAVMTHPFTRVVFRVSDDDARKLADGFAFFEASDLKNLETGQAVCRLERSDFDFNLSVALPELPDDSIQFQRQQAVIAASRQRYGTARGEVEALLRRAWELEVEKPTKPKPPPEDPPPTARPQPVAPTPLPPVVSTPPILPEPVPPSSPPPVVAESPPPTALSSEPPKPAEVPKSTEVQKKPVVETPAEASADITTVPPVSRDQGIGGNQHNLIRERIEAEGRKLGFTTSREQRVGKDKVDVVLENSCGAIACEIGITTSIDHEVGNARKCLQGQFRHVALIALSEDRLGKLKQAIEGCLPAEASRVGYYTPDQFIARLPELAQQMVTPPAPKTPGEKTYGKYKVKTKQSALSHAEAQEREDQTNRVIAETMRQRKGA